MKGWVGYDSGTVYTSRYGSGSNFEYRSGKRSYKWRGRGDVAEMLCPHTSIKTIDLDSGTVYTSRYGSGSNFEYRSGKRSYKWRVRVDVAEMLCPHTSIKTVL